MNLYICACNDACPGLFINESMLNVHLLIYVDDVAMINGTIGPLQLQLDVMGESCSKYGLSINISKTNIMMFRNVSQLRMNEKMNINNESLIETMYARYLSIKFSSILCWSTALRTLPYKGDIALYKLSRLLIANAMICLFNCRYQYHYTAASFGETLFELKLKAL